MNSPHTNSYILHIVFQALKATLTNRLSFFSCRILFDFNVGVRPNLVTILLRLFSDRAIRCVFVELPVDAATILPIFLDEVVPASHELSSLSEGFYAEDE